MLSWIKKYLGFRPHKSLHTLPAFTVWSYDNESESVELLRIHVDRTSIKYDLSQYLWNIVFLPIIGLFRVFQLQDRIFGKYEHEPKREALSLTAGTSELFVKNGNNKIG